MALLKGYRLRRGPAVGVLVVVGVVGSLLILATQLRPGVAVYAPVAVTEASAGTAYAVDEQLCLEGAQVGATVTSAEADGGGPLALQVGLPPAGRAPVIAFPIDAADLRPVRDARVPARDLLCLRLVLQADEEGTFAAPPVQVRLRYGPFGVFRRSLTVRPPSTLEVVRAGPDPRLAGS